jgi:hypothetical protein
VAFVDQAGRGVVPGDDLAAAGQGGVHVLRQPRVIQRRPGLLMAHDQPRRAPVGQGDLVYRSGRTHLREQREQVVAVVVTPRVERWPIRPMTWRPGLVTLSSMMAAVMVVLRPLVVVLTSGNGDDQVRVAALDRDLRDLAVRFDRGTVSTIMD